MAKEITIKKVLLGCWARYPQPPQDPNQQALVIAAWVDDLEDISDEALVAAAKEYWREANQWTPAPGMLRERALKLTGLDAESSASNAWGWLKEWIYSTARGETKEYEAKWGRDEAALEALRELGGFDAFYNRNTEFDFQWVERFTKIYGRIKSQKNLQLEAGEAMAANGAG